MAAPAFRNLGRSGLRVSTLCLGAMNFGNDQFGCDEETSIRVIDAYLDAGHNFIDTANVYAATRSETIVGKAVKSRRDRVVIATKAASPLGFGPLDSGTSRRHVVKACEDSLRRLDTDYIDLYQMHRYDEATPLEETVGTLNDLVRSGKVRYLGVSNWTATQIVEACAIAKSGALEPIVSLQPQYSILARDIEIEIVPVCRRYGIGVIPWSPLAGGMLSGKYRRHEEPQAGTRFAAPGPFQRVWRTRSLSERNHDIVTLVMAEASRLGVTAIQVALSWNLARPEVVAPIIGPKSEQQLHENLAALDVTLPDDVVERIDAESEPHVPYPHDFQRMLRQMGGVMAPREPAAPDAPRTGTR